MNASPSYTASATSSSARSPPGVPSTGCDVVAPKSEKWCSPMRAHRVAHMRSGAKYRFTARSIAPIRSSHADELPPVAHPGV